MMFEVKDEKDLDDVKQVMHHVRHSCEHIRGRCRLKQCVKVVAEKTGMDEERVEKIIQYCFKGR